MKVNKYKISLTLSLLGFALLSSVLWLGNFNTEVKALGLNFFTEILGVIVTVFLVDLIIQKREQQRILPLKISAYEDVRTYIGLIVSFWVKTFREVVHEDDPETLQDFFSENGMLKVLNNLNINSEANVIPPTKWNKWIVFKNKDFKEKGEKILERHITVLDPIAYRYIHNIVNSSFINALITNPIIKNPEIVSDYPKLQPLIKYTLSPTNEDYKDIIGLIEWCDRQYDEIKIKNPNINKRIQYEPQKGFKEKAIYSTFHEN